MASNSILFWTLEVLSVSGMHAIHLVLLLYLTEDIDVDVIVRQINPTAWSQLSCTYDKTEKAVTSCMRVDLRDVSLG